MHGGDPVRPQLSRLPPGATTRFAPAPTGYLHLGHVANGLYVWALARASGGRVVLRIEDHDRQRCRPEYEAALLEDLEWLGLAPDEPPLDSLRSGDPSPYRQSDSGAVYSAAFERLRAVAPVYACDCARSTFAGWAAASGRSWSGPGCPGGCRERALPDIRGRLLRVALGGGTEAFDDLLAGGVVDEPTADGDLPIRDRHGNWTYAFAVVVDDIRHEIDVVIRGRDLLHATGRQIRLARLLGRERPPAFLHHPLIRKPGGAKLSKADGDTGIRDLRAAGWSAERVLGAAAISVGLIAEPRPIGPDTVRDLFSST